MRALVVPELRRQYPGARIIHELPLRYSSNRIDLAAVTETEIVAVEIKSSRDVIYRLEKQLREFAPVSSRLIAALAPVWNRTLPMLEQKIGLGTSYFPQRTEAQKVIASINHPIEIWTVDAATHRVDEAERGWSRPGTPWSHRLLHMCHVAELLDIASRHRVAIAKRPTHFDLVKSCEDAMTGAEVRRAVCAALRGRHAFAAGTDPVVPVNQRRESPGSSKLGNLLGAS